MKTTQLLNGLALCCLLFLALAVSAQAQQGYGQPEQQQQMMPQPGAAGMDVSDAQLDMVAQAHVEINEIREELQESLAEVSDPQAAQQLQEQASQAMVEAVQNSGLDVQTYNQVMEAAQMNEELRDELFSRLRAQEQH